MKHSFENRKYIRIPMDMPVKFDVAAWIPQEARSKNICISGMFIDSLYPVHENLMLSLSFKLPGEKSEPVIVVPGNITHVKHRGRKQVGFGLRFFDLLFEHYLRLDAFINQYINSNQVKD